MHADWDFEGDVRYRDLLHGMIEALPHASVLVTDSLHALPNRRWSEIWFPDGAAHPPFSWDGHHEQCAELLVDPREYRAAWGRLEGAPSTAIIHRHDGRSFIRRRCPLPRTNGGTLGWLLLDEELSRFAHDVWEFEVRHRQANALWDTLTTREQEVLLLIQQGLTNREAAAALGISEKTVEKHRAAGMRRLTCRRVADLVRFVILLDGRTYLGDGEENDSP